MGKGEEFKGNLILSLTGFGLAVFAACGAYAGQTLHLRAGAIKPAEPTFSEQLKSASSRDVPTNYYIVQYKNRISAKQKQNLKSKGFSILRYMPDDAYLVKAPNHQAVLDVQNGSDVNAVVPYLASWRISPDMGPRHIFNANQKILVRVKLFDGFSSVAVDSSVQRLGIELASIDDDVLTVNIERGRLDDLASIDGVEWIEEMVTMRPLHLPLGELTGAPGPTAAPPPYSGFETGTKVMKFESAWERGFKGQGEVVAMADTGLDSGDLTSIYVDFQQTVSGGQAFGIYSRVWDDPMGHGTHVAGSVVNSGDGTNGQFMGGAPDAKLFAEGMWSRMMNNLTVPPQLSKLFDAAQKKGAFIHTNSWGSSQNPGAYDGFASQADEFMWKHPEFLLLFAAGNDGVDGNRDGRIDEGSVGSPGTAKNVLTVGASENYLLQGGIQKKLGDLLQGQPWGTEPLKSDTLSNNADGLAAFSSRGPTKDGRIKPEIVAPGTNIVSNCSHVDGASALWGKYDNNYCYSGGTSMSTPLTAGAAAVTRQYIRQAWHVDRPSAALVKAVMMNSADEMYPGQYGEVGAARGQEILKKAPNNQEGYGRVNVDRTTLNPQEFLVKLEDNKAGLSTGGSEDYEIDLPRGGLVKVTLVYTDAPGSPAAAKALVNDLDLTVEDGAGHSYVSQSRKDNSEQVTIEQVSGHLRAHVKAIGVPQGPQPYALVISQQ